MAAIAANVRAERGECRVWQAQRAVALVSHRETALTAVASLYSSGVLVLLDFFHIPRVLSIYGWSCKFIDDEEAYKH